MLFTAYWLFLLVRTGNICNSYARVFGVACLTACPSQISFQRSVVKVQFLLVLSAYKTSHQWLQHPSNTVNTLCGSDLGAAQAEGYLWWPDAGNTALSYCVQACPQAAGDQSLIISILHHIRRSLLQNARHGNICASVHQCKHPA